MLWTCAPHRVRSPAAPSEKALIPCGHVPAENAPVESPAQRSAFSGMLERMTSTDPFAGLYRPGRPFRSEELQMMEREGTLRHLVGDVYASTRLQDGPRLRALAVRLLLAQASRTSTVVCGEAACWVHLGPPAPERLTLCTESFLRGRARVDLDWQTHQVTLLEHEVLRIRHLRVTTAIRTAVDLFLGVGTVGSRGAVDKALEQQAFFRTELSHWPRRSPSLRPDDQVEALQNADVGAWTRRMQILGRLVVHLEDQGCGAEELAGEIMAVRARSYHRSSPTAAQQERILEALDHSVSRRLPTVLYTS